MPLPMPTGVGNEGFAVLFFYLMIPATTFIILLGKVEPIKLFKITGLVFILTVIILNPITYNFVKRKLKLK